MTYHVIATSIDPEELGNAIDKAIANEQDGAPRVVTAKIVGVFTSKAANGMDEIYHAILRVRTRS
jgi:hypothetical protein